MKTYFYYEMPDPVLTESVETARFVKELGVHVEVVTAKSALSAMSVMFDRKHATLMQKIVDYKNM